jgi:hypothetical protein
VDDIISATKKKHCVSEDVVICSETVRQRVKRNGKQGVIQWYWCDGDAALPSTVAGKHERYYTICGHNDPAPPEVLSEGEDQTLPPLPPLLEAAHDIAAVELQAARDILAYESEESNQLNHDSDDEQATRSIVAVAQAMISLWLLCSLFECSQWVAAY